MDISSFLAIIIYCCLLFMEFETKEEAAYVKLGTDLQELLCSLRDLQYDIVHAKVMGTRAIDGRIDGLIKMVDSATKDLTQKPKKKVRKNISISKPVQEVKHHFSHFSQLTEYSSDELDKLLEGTEKIWKEQIQTKVNEAIQSET